MLESKWLIYIGQIIWLVLLPLEALYFLHVSHGRDGWLLLNLSLCSAFIYPAVVLHELGHAAAALATGAGISYVRLGSGPPIARRRVFGVLIELNWPTMGGRVGLRSSDIYSHPIRLILFLAGGPAANLLLLLGAMARWPDWSRDALSLEQPHVVLAFILANLYLLVWTLLPIRARQGDGQRVASDGLQILRTIQGFFTPEKSWPETHVKHGIVLAKQGLYVQALAEFERAILVAPQEPWGFYNYAFTCALQGHDTLALNYFEQALAVAPDMAKALYGRGLMRLRLGQGEGTADLARAEAAEADTRAYFAQYGLSVPAGMDYTA